MRRGVSIILILFFGLGPLAAALPASNELRLPPCCRRHGAHHCAMMMRMKAQTASGKPAFSAPMHCPLYPSCTGATTTTSVALAASPARLPVLLAQAHSPAERLTAACLGPIRARAGRGPPANSLG